MPYHTDYYDADNYDPESLDTRCGVCRVCGEEVYEFAFQPAGEEDLAYCNSCSKPVAYWNDDPESSNYHPDYPDTPLETA